MLFNLIINSIRENSYQNIIACDFRHLLYFQINENIFKQNTLFYPDSSGIFFILKLFFHNRTKNFKRLVSTDIHYNILKYCTKNKLKLFLLGDASDILESFIKQMRLKMGDIQIVGFANGYNDLKEKKLIENINKSNADILMIGLGVPKQELWLLDHSDKINIPVRITVGAFFTYYSGKINRAPTIIRAVYLEWFFRFIKEPKRLFIRYFFDFPKAILLLLSIKWKK